MSGRDHPDVLVPPPAVYVIGFLVAVLVRNWLPRLALPFAHAIGAAVVAIALLLFTWGVITMKRAGTNVVPTNPSTTVVAHGPFRFTRNPLYLSMTLAYLGGALWLRATTALVLLPLLIIVMHFLVITREERYLEAKFGDDYRNYRQRVRRWL